MTFLCEGQCVPFARASISGMVVVPASGMSDAVDRIREVVVIGHGESGLPAADAQAGRKVVTGSPGTQ